MYTPSKPAIFISSDWNQVSNKIASSAPPNNILMEDERYDWSMAVGKQFYLKDASTRNLQPHSGIISLPAVRATPLIKELLPSEYRNLKTHLDIIPRGVFYFETLPWDEKQQKISLLRLAAAIHRTGTNWAFVDEMALEGYTKEVRRVIYCGSNNLLLHKKEFFAGAAGKSMLGAILRFQEDNLQRTTVSCHSTESSIVVDGLKGIPNIVDAKKKFPPPPDFSPGYDNKPSLKELANEESFPEIVLDDEMVERGFQESDPTETQPVNTPTNDTQTLSPNIPTINGRALRTAFEMLAYKYNKKLKTLKRELAESTPQGVAVSVIDDEISTYTAKAQIARRFSERLRELNSTTTFKDPMGELEGLVMKVDTENIEFTPDNFIEAIQYSIERYVEEGNRGLDINGGHNLSPEIDAGTRRDTYFSLISELPVGEEFLHSISKKQF